MSWDGFQREVLAELGHVLYVPLHARQAGAQAAMGAIDEAMLARIARAAGVDAEGLRAHADIAGVNWGRDLPEPEIADIRNVVALSLIHI